MQQKDFEIARAQGIKALRFVETVQAQMKSAKHREAQNPSPEYMDCRSSEKPSKLYIFIFLYALHIISQLGALDGEQQITEATAWKIS